MTGDWETITESGDIVSRTAHKNESQNASKNFEELKGDELVKYWQDQYQELIWKYNELFVADKVRSAREEELIRKGKKWERAVEYVLSELES